MYFDEEFFSVITAMVTAVPSGLFSIGVYVMTAYALYSIAQRRGIEKAWMAWIPVINVWIVGSLSDQYQYLVKGQNKSKRKILLVLNILQMVFAVTVGVLAVVMAAGAILAESDAAVMSTVVGPLMAVLGLCLPLIGVAIAQTIIRYMAMFDIYRSCDPDNSILYLVLSILINITEPFFLFFNRNKDTGMPPRKQPEPACAEPVSAEPVYAEPVYAEPVYAEPVYAEPVQEAEIVDAHYEQPSDGENKDYL